MPAKVRIKLSSIDVDALNPVIQSIKDITDKTGVVMRGPIPLPTKRLKVTTRKSPCGNGTATFDRFEMRVHRRIIDLPAEDRILHPIMKLAIPRSVQIKIEMKD
jgi:small subunit ribosomal protein S10